MTGRGERRRGTRPLRRRAALLLVPVLAGAYKPPGLSAGAVKKSRSVEATTRSRSNRNRVRELEEARALIDLELAELRPSPQEQMRALYAAFNARDADAVADLLTEDGVYEDLLLGDTTVCVGREKLKQVLHWHPAFVMERMGVPCDVRVVVDHVACDGASAVGVEWHVEVGTTPLPLGRGLSLATLDPATGKLARVVDICEAPWRVVGLVVRPALSFTVGAASAAAASAVLFQLLGLVVLA